MLARFAIVFLIVPLTTTSAGATLSAPEWPEWPMDKFAPTVQRQLREAFARFQTNPEDAAAAGELGLLLHTYAEYAAAIPFYEKARSLDNNEFRWAYYLGAAHAALGQHGKAVDTFRAASQLKPDYLACRIKLAEALLAAENQEESELVYTNILAEFPDSARAHYGLGRVRASRGDLKGAAEHYKNACRIYPNYGAAHYALALVYRDLNDNEKAQIHLKRYENKPSAAPPENDPLAEVLQLNRAANSHLERAVDLESAGKTQVAIEEYERALTANPRLKQAHVSLILLYGEAGNLKEAQKHYREALALSPNLAEAHNNYGVVLFHRNQLEEANRAFTKALEINPHYAEAHYNLGYLLEQEGRLDQASSHYRKALQNDPNYRPAHFHLGKLLLGQEKFQEAIEHFSQTLRPEDEDTPGYMYALAMAHARAGNYEVALKHAREARRRAAELGQTELVTSIDKDLELLKQVLSR